MLISLASMWTAIFSGMVMCLVLYILLRLMGSYEEIFPYTIIVCIILTMLRILMPFEFEFSNTVLLSVLLPSLKKGMTLVLIQIRFVKIEVWMLLCIIWFVVAVIKIGVLIAEYFVLKMYVLKLPDIRGDIRNWLYKEECLFQMNHNVQVTIQNHPYSKMKSG